MLLILLTYFTYVSGLNMNGRLSTNDILKYKSVYPQIPFKTLIKEIDENKVENIYFVLFQLAKFYTFYQVSIMYHPH